MTFSSLLACLVILIHSACAIVQYDPTDPRFVNASLAHAFSEEAINRLAARQNAQLVTAGAAGSLASRLEIRQLYSQYPDQWTLLILGLEAFHAQSQSSPLSYFGISSIHGVPRQDWNGVPSCGQNCSSANGYCPHDMCIFPTWHRAYLALFEQQFLAAVSQIADAWPVSNRTRMQAAASAMRFPYYDWAAAPPPGGQAYPTQLSDAQVTINAQNGQRTLNNPLASHLFSDPRALSLTPFSNWRNTLKYPSSNSASAQSRTQYVINALANNRRSLRDQLYQLLTNCNNYAYFSNDAASSSSASCANSLEGIHNTVHSIIGGSGSRYVSGGHMSYLELAAFDPAFWLHHMNVDRIFAIWQALNTDWTCQQKAPHNTYTISRNSFLNQDYPLLPFRRDTSNGFWTSNQVRDWRIFNYDYPEFFNSDRSKTAITAYVNRLYAPNATATAGSSRRSIGHAPRSIVGTSSLSGKTISNLDALLQASNGSNFQYVANLRTPRYALNGSYVIYAFDGAPTGSPDAWPAAANLIGLLGVLSMPHMQETDLDVTGSVPLTSALADLVAAGGLSSLQPAHVATYLRRNLQWRIVGPDGAEFKAKDIPGLQISIYMSTSTLISQPGELPKWSRFIALPL